MTCEHLRSRHTIEVFMAGVAWQVPSSPVFATFWRTIPHAGPTWSSPRPHHLHPTRQPHGCDQVTTSRRLSRLNYQQ